MIKSSELTLDGEPILKDVDDGKTLTFQFMPIKVRNVDYTVKEIITMKNGDPFIKQSKKRRFGAVFLCPNA